MGLVPDGLPHLRHLESPASDEEFEISRTSHCPKVWSDCPPPHGREGILVSFDRLTTLLNVRYGSKLTALLIFVRRPLMAPHMHRLGARHWSVQGRSQLWLSRRRDEVSSCCLHNTVFATQLPVIVLSPFSLPRVMY